MDTIRTDRYLYRRLDTLEHPQTHDGPGCQQTADDVSVERARLIDWICDIQSFAVPEIRRGRTLDTFLYWWEKEKYTSNYNAYIRHHSCSQLCEFWTLMRRVYLLHSPVLGTSPKVMGAGMSSRDRKDSMQGSHCSREPQRNKPENSWKQDNTLKPEKKKVCTLL